LYGGQIPSKGDILKLWFSALLKATFIKIGSCIKDKSRVQARAVAAREHGERRTEPLRPAAPPSGRQSCRWAPPPLSSGHGL